MFEKLRELRKKWRLKARKEQRLEKIKAARREFLRSPVLEQKETDERIYSFIWSVLYGCRKDKIPPYYGMPIHYAYLNNRQEETTSFTLEENWERLYNYFEICCKTRDSAARMVRRIEKINNWARLKRWNLFHFPYDEDIREIYSILPKAAQNNRLMRLYPKSFNLIKNLETMLILTGFGSIFYEFLSIPDRYLALAIRFCIKKADFPMSMTYLENNSFINGSDGVKVDLHNYIVNLQSSIPEEWIKLFNYTESYPNEEDSKRVIVLMAKRYWMLDKIKNILEKHLQHNKFRKIGESF